ncbi:hypothetical protein [Micromonospora sp. NPDC023633]|uniref:hypothetical protein n=1 Tax=Micromonospora sp. NPDC023633 TaxID=3154320 RepID=UPI0033FD8059
MADLTVAERVMQELQRTRLPLDDDELARRLGVQPRQTINQVCRRLEENGRIRRYVGPRGKIVNEHLAGTRPAGSVVQQEVLPEPAAGDSAAQRRAEGVMLRLLSDRLGRELKPRKFMVADGARVEVDGADEDLTVLVEAWAHQGRRSPLRSTRSWLMPCDSSSSPRPWLPHPAWCSASPIRRRPGTSRPPARGQQPHSAPFTSTSRWSSFHPSSEVKS